MRSIGMRSEATLLFGGTFDPVHKGHLYIASKALEMMPYQRLIFMPAWISNYKQGSHPASAEDRYNMLTLAVWKERERNSVWKDREVIVSRYEIDKGGVSYTSDTVRYLYSTGMVSGRLGFLMGDDLLSGLDGWHESGYLKDSLDYICFRRDGETSSSLPGIRLKYIPVEPCLASSSAIRDGDYSMLTDEVLSYAKSNHLYGT